MPASTSATRAPRRWRRACPLTVSSGSRLSSRPLSPHAADSVARRGRTGLSPTPRRDLASERPLFLSFKYSRTPYFCHPSCVRRPTGSQCGHLHDDDRTGRVGVRCGALPRTFSGQARCENVSRRQLFGAKLEPLTERLSESSLATLHERRRFRPPTNMSLRVGLACESQKPSRASDLAVAVFFLTREPTSLRLSAGEQSRASLA